MRVAFAVAALGLLAMPTSAALVPAPARIGRTPRG